MTKPQSDRILRELRSRIAAGEQMLPPERQLAVSLGVSRSTIRSALARLADEGALIRQRGRGTAVASRSASQRIVHLLYPSRHDIGSGDTYMVALVEAVARRLGIDSEALMLTRVPAGERLLPLIAAGGMAPLRGGGVIVVGDPGDHDGLGRLQEVRVPVVVVADPLAAIPAPTIGGDHAAVVGAAFAHLLTLGHRRIALIDGPASDIFVGHRRAGYRAAVAAAGLAPIEVPTIGWDSQAGAASALALLALPERPSALIAYGDYATVGLVGTLRSHGLVVPRDLSVVVIDHRLWIDRVLGQAMTGWYESPDVVAEVALAALAAQREGRAPACGVGSVPFFCREGSSCVER